MKTLLALIGLLAVLKCERDIRKSAFVQLRVTAFNNEKAEDFEQAYRWEMDAIRRMYQD